MVVAAKILLFFVLLSVIYILISLFQPARAHELNCVSHSKAVSMLNLRFGERAYSEALTEDGVIFELWGDEKDGSWTAILIRPDGLACRLASGSMFRPLPASPAGEDL